MCVFWNVCCAAVSMVVFLCPPPCGVSPTHWCNNTHSCNNTQVHQHSRRDTHTPAQEAKIMQLLNSSCVRCSLFKCLSIFAANLSSAVFYEPLILIGGLDTAGCNHNNRPSCVCARMCEACIDHCNAEHLED